jgi:DNA-binding MarR family transcriptional regulator
MQQRWDAEGLPGAPALGCALATLRASQLIRMRMDAILKQLRLSRTSFLLLSLLLVRERPTSLGSLSRQLIVHPTTVAQTVDQLQRLGLVSRVVSETDRRTVLVAISEEGRDVLTRAATALDGANYGLGATSPATAATMSKALRRTLSAMEAES